MSLEIKEKGDAWYWFVVGFMFRGESNKSQSHKLTKARFEKHWDQINSLNDRDVFLLGGNLLPDSNIEGE